MHWGTWRVNGQLAVSRAIGDGEYKPYISADPDVTTVVMNGSEEFLIVGCDGLWDTITPEEATDIVFDHLEEKKEQGGDIENISAKLATFAKDKGSGDNITIIVVFLKPLDELIKLGKLTARDSGSAEPDIEGITTTSDYVFSTGGRDSLEPSKDKPDFTSPNVNFASEEGGAMFSPDPFGNVEHSLGNGFNMSSENFDNKIEDKRFSNESDRISGVEAFNNDQMNDLLNKQSIDKVDDLLKMLDREDSSPTPDNDDARPLEEILAAAREQPEDQVDGVEDDVDSSDDEIVELRRNGGNSSSSSGNSQLEEVLKLDDGNLNEEEDDNFSASTPSNGLPPLHPEPTMDPCEQVTVVETGPEECGTLVPPTQELPSHQEPVLEIVDTMTCSMVKEEIMDQEGSNGVDSNGVGDTVSFEGAEGEGFMLKTPGEQEQELADFTPEVEHERETSVDTGESVEDSKEIPSVEPPSSLQFSAPEEPEVGNSGGLGIPNVQITPATPTRARTPESDSTQVVEKEEDPILIAETVSDVVVPSINTTEPSIEKQDLDEIPDKTTTEPVTEKQDLVEIPDIITTEPTPVKQPVIEVPSIVTTEPTPMKPTSTKAATPKGATSSTKTNGSGTPSITGKPAASSANKSSKPQVKTTAGRPATATKTAAGPLAAKVGPTKPATTPAPKTAGARPTSSTGAGRAKPTDTSKTGVASNRLASRQVKPTSETNKQADAAKRPTKPLTTTARVTDRKPLAAKPAENGPAKPTVKPAVPRTIPSKPKPAETKTDQPKRPTTSTVPRPPAAKSSASSRPTVSRQPSNASSSSSARPRPTVSKTTMATSRVNTATNKPAAGTAKAAATPRPTSSTTTKSTGLSRSSSSATTRPSATASRSATSTAVKPSAAAERVAKARAAAKAAKPGVGKVKAAGVNSTPTSGKKEPEKKVDTSLPAEVVETNGAPSLISEDAAAIKAETSVTTDEVHETINKNVATGDVNPGSGEQATEEDGPHLNGVSEVEQVSEC